MKDTLSRILAVLGVVIAIGTLAALVAVWGMLNDRVDGVATTVMSQGERIEGLEQASDEMEMEEEDESLGVDARPVMPEDYQGTLSPNLEQANTTVEYRNADIGLAFQVPYNSAWGNSAYRIEPYDEFFHDDGTRGLYFGPAFPFEGGGWARGMSLFVKPAASAADAIAMIQETEGDFLEDRPIETLTIGGKEVVVYYSGGLCSYVNVQVVGERFNYALWPTCGDDDATRATLLQIVETMTFIE